MKRNNGNPLKKEVVVLPVGRKKIWVEVYEADEFMAMVELPRGVYKVEGATRAEVMNVLMKVIVENKPSS
ncbi:hypothetical protein LCM20_10045 [Halobacillus litoralis]|uniref:hypothetical protein n=1 Tax=Halobacillus litoralis TaxID=45668 RepID=UPI001CD394F1|nr:hypothetical protein [Halobacillus litoralis]MCA0970931.1 hypothetical protein [Halobacillus litoralis]